MDEEGNPIDPGKLKYAVIGLMFSVEDYDKRITSVGNQTVQDFIYDLKFSDYDPETGKFNEPKVDEVKLGNLLGLANFENRWVYHGSLTTPPCSPEVYWNVINFIFPIKIEEFEYVQKMMKAYKKKIGGTQTNRIIQPIKN